MENNWQGKVCDKFGFPSLRESQVPVIEAILRGEDVLAVMPTGSGKSLCFQSPAAVEARGRSSLVVSPLIALMREQVDRLAALGFRASYLNHAVDADERRSILDSVRQGDLDFLYSSPEQLKKADLNEAVGADPARISRLVADEAHCISTWGHDFRPDFYRIGEFRRRHSIGQTVATTATATPQVIADVLSSLGIEDAVQFVHQPIRENLSYSVIDLDDPETSGSKISHVTSLIDRFAPGEEDAVIVYCTSRIETDRLSQSLKRKGYKADLYHGNMPDNLRQEKEANFTSGKCKIMVATNAFGMGIDKSNVRLIVHTGVPESAMAYVQETGRAGRDGQEAHCVLLKSSDQFDSRIQRIEKTVPSFQMLRTVFDKLKEMKKNTSLGEPFKFNIEQLYMRFMCSNVKGSAPNSSRAYDEECRRTKINACLHMLQSFGLIVRDASCMTINADLIEGTEIFESLEAIIKRRLDVKKALVEQLMRYTESGEQETLMELLRTDLDIE